MVGRKLTVISVLFLPVYRVNADSGGYDKVTWRFFCTVEISAGKVGKQQMDSDYKYHLLKLREDGTGNEIIRCSENDGQLF